MITRINQFALALAATSLFATFALAEDQYELPPIEYSKATPDNRVSALQAALDAGVAKLAYADRHGYLPALLESLGISPETQLLVFSKTSMQRERISPRTPRAIYFDDDVYIGYCHAGKQIELAVADPQLGAVFYTMDQQADEAPKLVRQTHRCLQCHGATESDAVPAFMARSLFVDSSGQPILSEGSHMVDHTTPFKDRWGGWYVTGTHGSQSHLGNQIIADRDAPKPWTNEAGVNVTDLSDRFRTENYLNGHSDVVALMVFEHQTHVHNLITKANFAAKQALHYQLGLNRALGEPDDNRLESTTRRIQNAGDKLVEGLLLVGEAPLLEPIAGTSKFADEFAALGPTDAQGRSLRDLDLKTRLFKYPCSFLVYSLAFDGLHPEMKAYVAERLRDILLAGGGGVAFARLSPDDRQAIAEILRETKPELLAAD